MSLLSGSQLTCIRGEQMVFSGLDFELESGGMLVLVGPNGSGKSSLLRMMCGLLVQAQGSLCWDSEEIGEDREAHNARLHYVGHQDANKVVLSVRENLTFWAAMHSGGGNAETISGRVGAALATFGIAYLADVPTQFLSAGQRRRVSLARIASSPAKLWLLDEPTTALDTSAIAALEQTLAVHRADGGMVAISTHSHIGGENTRTLDLTPFALARSEVRSEPRSDLASRTMGGEG
jgi:heme exporter protein A